ncbi:MAG: hypothetical protein IJ339_01075 [Oscillospiraceae bacterium]|nr:hypothetical protein [Oscillospiraceae bacterium]
MGKLKDEILSLYPSMAAFADDAKISRKHLYDIVAGKAKLTRIMERRIKLTLADKRRRCDGRQL